MNLAAMICPKCGGQIKFDDDQDYVFCSHCGTQIFKDSENKKVIVHKYVNETRVKEVESNERMFNARLEHMEKVRPRAIGILLLMALMCFLFVIIVFKLVF